MMSRSTARKLGAAYFLFIAVACGLFMHSSRAQAASTCGTFVVPSDAEIEARNPEAVCAGNMMEMTFCAREQYEAADEALNTTYKELIEALTNVNELWPASEPAKTEVTMMRRSQRAWLDFKVKECERVFEGAGGGSIGPFEQLTCLMELTVERHDHLCEQLLYLQSKGY